MEFRDNFIDFRDEQNSTSVVGLHRRQIGSFHCDLVSLCGSYHCDLVSLCGSYHCDLVSLCGYYHCDLVSLCGYYHCDLVSLCGYYHCDLVSLCGYYHCDLVSLCGYYHCDLVSLCGYYHCDLVSLCGYYHCDLVSLCGYYHCDLVFLCSLSELLDEHNPWFCPRCERNQCAKKTMTVWRYPDNLIIHLKRSVGNIARFFFCFFFFVGFFCFVCVCFVGCSCFSLYTVAEVSSLILEYSVLSAEQFFGFFLPFHGDTHLWLILSSLQRNQLCFFIFSTLSFVVSCLSFTEKIVSDITYLLIWHFGPKWCFGTGWMRILQSMFSQSDISMRLLVTQLWNIHQLVYRLT